jgi:exodeoxyribonuclease V gamma subunit
LASLLATPLRDPFAAEVLAVPTAGVRDWLQRQLALRLGATGRHDGVSANIDMVFPGQFVARALGQPADAVDPWDIDHLTWAVLQVLDNTQLQVPGYAKASTQQTPSMAPRTRYATARRIADLFDRYANNRPAMLHQWHHGFDGDGTLDERDAVVPLVADQRWQPELWRQVRALIGVPNRAELLPQLLDDLANGRIVAQLPQRVAVFGVSATAPGQLSVLTALAQVRDVHVYLVHPSAVAWQHCRQQLQGRLTLRSTCDATAAVHHPLLRSWARPAMEAAALVGGLSAEQHVYTHLAHKTDAPGDTRDGGTGDGGTGDGGTGTSSDSLLRQLQADIAADREPRGLREHVADNSVQIHACHGATRQLEVLRDALGHLFAADRTLAPHDVIIVCPDLPRFAPLIASVFQRGSFPVPVQVTDLSLGTGNPVATALAVVIDVVSGRCTASDVLGLCALAPVQRKLGLTDDDISRIDQWVGELGTTWGLDADHRSHWVPAHITEGTWESALDRLLLGAAMPSPVPRVGPAHVVPFDDVSADGFRTAGLLAELIALLRVARLATSGEHSITHWTESLANIVGSLCATSAQDAWQLAEVMQELAALGEQAVVAGAPCDVNLSLADIRSLLHELINEPHGRLNLRSGSVTATAMVPVRNVPARVVCVLGLDEGSLRTTGADGDDLISWHPCVGERDPRVEGRHLLLDALMAAGDQLIITCDGNDITTNRQLPLPVQIMELRDVVTATLKPNPVATGDPGAAADAVLITRHPRQTYDERNFVHPVKPPFVSMSQPFGFDDAMLAAAITRRVTREASGHQSDPAAPAVLSPIWPTEVTLPQLTDACARPARTYLLDRLDVRIPHAPEEIENDIPIVVNPLEAWRLGNSLLQQYRNSASADNVQAWRSAQSLTGALPPRQLAENTLSTIEHEVAGMLGADRDLATLISQCHTEPIDVGLGVELPGGGEIRLVDTLDNVADDILVRVLYTRPRPRLKIAAALGLAAAVVAQPSRNWQVILVTRAASGTGKPIAERLTPVAEPRRSAAAQQFLHTAIELRLQALREPLALFDKSSYRLYATGSFDDVTFDDDLRDEFTAFIWGHSTVDDILSAVGEFSATALAHTLWDAYNNFVETSS